MSQEADDYAAQETARLFRGRKGHGGGPCTRRVMRPADLRLILRGAFLAGMAHMNRSLQEHVDMRRKLS